MMQFYFLSVLINCVVGISLLFINAKDEKYKFFDFTKNPRFKLITGILACIISLITLCGSYEGSWPFLGDLIPSLTGLWGGFTLLYSFYLDKRTLEAEQKERKFDSFLTDNSKYFGVTCLVAALFHFLFPKVIIL